MSFFRSAARPTPAEVASPPPAYDVPTSLIDGPYEKVSSDVGDLWMSTADQVMRDHLRSTGTWEPEEGRLLRRLLRPGARFLDVGANVGYFSLLAAVSFPGVTIDSVEPYPYTVPILRMNLWLNGVHSNVWPVALDKTRRALSIAAATNNVGDARVSERNGEGEFADLIVPAVTGDEIFAGRGFDVIKIDVQGWELEVLTGMAGVLAASPEVRIVAEFWPGALRERDIDPLERLARYRDVFGFKLLVSLNDDLEDLKDEEILKRCDNAGPNGQVNLLLGG
jgi:FkbM family methyltransferase